MGYNLAKRLLDLRRETDEELSGRWSIKRTTFITLILLVIARFALFPLVQTPSIDPSTSKINNEVDAWFNDIHFIVRERVEFLHSSPVVIFPGTSEMYQELVRFVDSTFRLENESNSSDNEIEAPFEFYDVFIWVNRAIAGAILRVGFIFLAFWPLWVLGFFSGFLLIKLQHKRKGSETILGVCDRGNGPFYSGIYGPFKPNNSYSGSDLSCPGLACPKMAERTEIEKTTLANLLYKHKARNDTNIQLLQVIHAHADFPHIVEPESSIQQEELPEHVDGDPKVSKTGFVSNEEGTLLSGVSIGLPAILEAHTIAQRYVSNLKKQKFTKETLNKNYPSHMKALEKVAAPLSELSKTLLFSLTPNRLWAIAETPSTLVASAYLAIEAGKSLVYKPHASSYSRISLYPQLQARAVIQSLVPYHKEYNGDSRLIIRQAIISSRRHGDFGRAFLPFRMPAQSRAIRDWLEIMYSDSKTIEDTASLVELDGNIEEIHINFRSRLSHNIKENHDPKDRKHKLWKGLVCKSVVLLPLEDLVSSALKGFHGTRLKRIAKLLDTTRIHQSQITTSARLPGFKRQAMEATNSGEELDLVVRKIRALPNGDEIYNKWRIVRRMLTKYNWLSTRVGDNSVPLVGVVHGILSESDKSLKENHLFMDALAPLRQRRFNEILGKNWENNYYKFSPNQDNIEVFVSTEEYEEKLKQFDAKPAPDELMASDNEENEVKIAG